MAKLTDFKLLDFDVYGTIIDWEAGNLAALKPLLEKNGKADMDTKKILKALNEVEAKQQSKTPKMKYSDLLTTCYPLFAEAIDCEKPSDEESRAFGDSVGKWPAFPDSVDALKRLSKHFKLAVLSNVDNDSFQKSVKDQLGSFQFDAVLTAQDIGSYKPSVENFEYMFKAVKDKFGIERNQVLQTAQSQFHDHQPAKKLGLKSAWICRRGATMGNNDEPVYHWKFDTLAEMADAVEAEVKARDLGVEGQCD